MDDAAVSLSCPAARGPKSISDAMRKKVRAVSCSESGTNLRPIRDPRVRIHQRLLGSQELLKLCDGDARLSAKGSHED
jgi:hypothetical protein